MAGVLCACAQSAAPDVDEVVRAISDQTRSVGARARSGQVSPALPCASPTIALDSLASVSPDCSVIKAARRYATFVFVDGRATRPSCPMGGAPPTPAAGCVVARGTRLCLHLFVARPCVACLLVCVCLVCGQIL